MPIKSPWIPAKSPQMLGGLEHFSLFHILGMSSFQLTNHVSGGRSTTNITTDGFPRSPGAWLLCCAARPFCVNAWLRRCNARSGFRWEIPRVDWKNCSVILWDLFRLNNLWMDYYGYLLICYYITHPTLCGIYVGLFMDGLGGLPEWNLTHPSNHFKGDCWRFNGMYDQLDIVIWLSNGWGWGLGAPDI